MGRGRIVVLLSTVLLICATVVMVRAWPRFETGFALLVEVVLFALLATIFWRSRVRVGKLVDELLRVIERRRKRALGGMAPAALGAHLLAELSAGPFAPALVQKVKDRIDHLEWHDLKAEWPKLSSELFAERTSPDAVKEASLVLAYVSLCLERLSA